MNDLIVSPCSDPNTRPENQDAFGHFETAYGPLFLVADGTGGPGKGKFAAEYAVRHFPDFLSQCSRQGMSARAALVEAFRRVNLGLIRKTEGSPELQGMATTLVLALETPAGFLIGHVGDSRAYHLSPHGIHALTLDHSEVAEQCAKGLISPQEARAHPKAHVIYKAAGSGPDIQLDLRPNPVDLAPGEGLMLCSDGLTGQVSDESVLARFLQTEGPDSVAQNLVRLAKEQGSTDNITVLYLQRTPTAAPPPVSFPKPKPASSAGVPIPSRTPGAPRRLSPPLSVRGAVLLAVLLLLGCALTLFHYQQIFSIGRRADEPGQRSTVSERKPGPAEPEHTHFAVAAETPGETPTDVDLPDRFGWDYRDCPSGLAETSKTLLGGIERSLANQAPIDSQKEMELGQKLADQFLKKYRGKVDRDQAWVAYLDRVGQTVTAKSKRTDIGYTFYLIEDDLENALALPGGHIMVFRGLLERQIGNEAQLAFVLAHEMNHVDQRHTLALLDLIAPLSLPDDAAMLLNSYLKIPFTMTQEEEADRMALDLIRALGYSPYQAVYLVQKMGADDPAPPREGLIEGVLGELETLLATHPNGERRTCLLKNQVAGIPHAQLPDYYYVGQTNYQTQTAMIDKRY